jgi:L-threonylcarbamoyladenylate synthase
VAPVDAVLVSHEQAAALASCIAGGGVAVFPADTVYGLACDPANEDAIDRLAGLKRRDPAKPSAVMFFALEPALETLTGLGERTRAALEMLLPGPVTLLLPNPSGLYPAACGADPSTLGVRVPALGPTLEALERVHLPVLQTSANEAGAPDTRRVQDVPAAIREHADLVIDGGELPGVASTVLDLTALDDGGGWEIVREGALSADEIARRLG